MRPANLLFILSDQHSRDKTGCYGHPLVRTPHIDGLAARGTRFSNAYTNCPICVPARAALATGRYVHQTGFWDNGIPYDGSVPSWGHRLKAQGTIVDAIGKLHFRSPDDDNGFRREVGPLHVVDGLGDLLGCLRQRRTIRNKRSGVLKAGPGDSTYLQYDLLNAERACQWLTDHASASEPWVLFLSFVCPHPPYIAPPSLYDLYPAEGVPLPPQWRFEDWPRHPTMVEFRRFFGFSEPFDESVLRNLARAYYGVCTYLDLQIGKVLNALEENGLRDRTRIVYSSDHGDCLGARGIFGKFTMYEESAAVPLILCGPDVPEGRVVRTPVSLVDCFPTVLEAVGASPAPEARSLPGGSLWSIARRPDRERSVLSEYHALGSQRAVYMLRSLRYKYVYSVDDPPLLFDLESDPDETTDISRAPGSGTILSRFEARLRSILDPEATDARAKADQRRRIEAFGGEAEVRKRGAFTNSPVPGEPPAFDQEVPA